MAQVINATVMKAGANYASGDFDKAAASIREAMTQIAAAIDGGSAELYDALVPAMQRIEKAHTMLEFEGVSLPPFRRPKRPELEQPMPSKPSPQTRPVTRESRRRRRSRSRPPKR